MAQRQAANRRSSGAASARGGGGLTPSAQGSAGAGGGLTPKNLPPGTDLGQVFRLTLPFSMKHMKSEGELSWLQKYKADAERFGCTVSWRAARRAALTSGNAHVPYIVTVTGTDGASILKELQDEIYSNWPLASPPPPQCDVVWVEPGGDLYEIAEGVQVSEDVHPRGPPRRPAEQGGWHYGAARQVQGGQGAGGGQRRGSPSPDPLAAAIAAACPPQAEGEVGGETIIGVIAAIAVA